MKKNKILKAIVPAAFIVGTISPLITSCNKTALVVKSITAEFKDGRKFYKVGETIKTDDILVTALYDSGQTKTLEYDSEGKKGYVVDSDESTYPLDHKFILGDLKRECVLKIKFGETTFDFKYDVDYSEKVNLYLDNVTIDYVSPIVQGQNIVVTYKPKDNTYCTMYEETGVEINGVQYNAYENPDVITFDWVALSNGATRAINMIIDGSKVSSDSAKIKIVDANMKDVSRVTFKPCAECKIVGSKFSLAPNGTLWKDVSKPKVVCHDPTHYMFTKWVDKDGNEITDYTQIVDDMVVTAFCEPADRKVTLTHSSGITIEPEVIYVPNGKKWSLIKNQITVTWDPHVKFMGWFDTNGQEIADDYQIEGDFTANAKGEVIKQRTITLQNDDGCTISQEPLLVYDGTTWAEAKEIADQRVTLKDKYHFVSWKYEDGTDIPLNAVITSNFNAYAHTEMLGEFSLEIKAPFEQKYSYYHYVQKEPKGTTINPLMFAQTQEWDGRTSIPGWSNPTFTNGKLIFESPNKEDSFRFIYQVLEIDMVVPGKTTKKIEFKFRLSDETWMNGNVCWSYSYHTTQIFDLGTSYLHAPQFFTNTRYDDEKFDPMEIPNGHSKSKHETWWCPPKHWNDSSEKSITITVENINDQPVNIKRYFGISYMIAAPNNEQNGDQRGKLVTDISWKLVPPII